MAPCITPRLINWPSRKISIRQLKSSTIGACAPACAHCAASQCSRSRGWLHGAARHHHLHATPLLPGRTAAPAPPHGSTACTACIARAPAPAPSPAGQLVAVTGTVVRMSPVRPIVKLMHFICAKCAARITQPFEDGKYTPPTQCESGCAGGWGVWGGQGSRGAQARKVAGAWCAGTAGPVMRPSAARVAGPVLPSPATASGTRAPAPCTIGCRMATLPPAPPRPQPTAAAAAHLSRAAPMPSAWIGRS